MRKYIFCAFFAYLVVFLISIVTPKETLAQAIPPTIDCSAGFNNVAPGVSYKFTTATNPRLIAYHIAKIDLNDPNIDLMVTPQSGLGTTTSTFLNTYGAAVAINGDLHWSLTDPAGLAASQGNQYSDPSSEPSLFAAQDNSVSFFNRGGQPLWDAISGSNALVRSGNIAPNYITCDPTRPQDCVHIHPRTAIGLTSNNTLILIVVDGRQTNYSIGITLRELASMMNQCNVQSAINLDGGGSSTMVVSGQGVVNSPSDGSERVVSNHFGVCVGPCNLSATPIPPTPGTVTGDARPRYTGPTYPFPCNRIAPNNAASGDTEFHSLRPYQASPCDQGLHDIALYCGNSILVQDTQSITFQFNSQPATIGTPTNSCGRSMTACDPNNPGTAGCCEDQCDGTSMCHYLVDNTSHIAIDLSGAELPIMGFTEPSVGNQGRPNQVTNQYYSNENLPDADKVNEYVSWYLNGVNERAEYSYLDTQNTNTITSMTSPSDTEKLVNFSGPLKKLLSNRSQRDIRENVIQDAVQSRSNNAGIRHDQVAGCLYGISILGQTIAGVPAPCVDNSTLLNLLTQRLHLSDWSSHFPPNEDDPQYTNFQQFYLDFLAWRGQTCFPITILPGFPLIGGKTFFLCFDNPLRANYWSNLFTYIPFSSTEDRRGSVEIQSSSIQPLISSNFRIILSEITNQQPADLFFPHMIESSQLGRILQQTYTASDLQRNQTIDSHDSGGTVSVSSNQFCDLREVRTNPGDDLFAGEVSADLHYQAIVSCEFFNGNAQTGAFCNSFGGTCNSLPYSNYSCSTYYDNLDCGPGEFCGEGCSQPPANCLPLSSLCTVGVSPGCCPTLSCLPTGGIPGQTGCISNLSISPPPDQHCSVDVLVTLNLVTKSPLVDDVWARLVAGPASVFKRIFPKVDTNAPVTSIWDIPASTSVTYNTSASTAQIVQIGNPGGGRSQPELYFPHIGGIHQYFLNCIQTALRPQGFGNPCISAPASSGSTSGGGVYTGTCQPAGVGWCSVATLTNELQSRGLNWTAQQILYASIICNRESGGSPTALNTGCLTGSSCDYSIGLFQINALPGRCPQAFDPYGDGDWGCDFQTHTYWCTPKSQADAQACIAFWSDATNNIDKMISLSRNGTCWAPWSAANACGVPLGNCP
jgi:hypothetical protein